MTQPTLDKAIRTVRDWLSGEFATAMDIEDVKKQFEVVVDKAWRYEDLLQMTTPIQNPKDECAWCGDYREDHDDKGCIMCRTPVIRHAWDRCDGFREATRNDVLEAAAVHFENIRVGIHVPTELRKLKKKPRLRSVK